MKKFIFFFLLSFYLYAEGKKEEEKIFGYVKYLSQRRIIENIQINEKETLNKGEFINTLHKLIKSIDKSKVAKEDLKIIENMLYEITTFINKFKLEVDNNTKQFDLLKQEFNKLKDEISNKLEANSSRINVIENTLKSQFEMESSLKEFLKEYKFNFVGDLSALTTSPNEVNIDFRWSLLTKISKAENKFKFLYDKESKKDAHLIFKCNIFPISYLSAYIKNYSHTFISPFGEVFYSNYSDYSKVIGIRNQNIFDICILKDENINLLTNIDIKYFFLFSHFFSEDYLNNLENNFLEIGAKFPLISDIFWIGSSYLRKENEDYADFYLGYLFEGLNLKLSYKDNFSSVDRKRDLKLNTSYTFSPEFKLGARAIINFPNIDPTIENIFEAWEFFINTKSNFLNLDLSINSKKTSKKNEIFGVLVSNLKYSNFEFKLGSILKDPQVNNTYRLCLFSRAEYFIYEHLNLYLQYIKSNFDYENNEMNLEGKKYNIIFSKIRTIIEKDKYGTLSFGFKLNI